MTVYKVTTFVFLLKLSHQNNITVNAAVEGSSWCLEAEISKTVSPTA